MLTSVSPELRKYGKILADIGKDIEDRQVEDGDPPFRVTHKQYKELAAAREHLEKIILSVTTEGEAEDQGEDHLGE
jgi:hypothetical protein